MPPWISDEGSLILVFAELTSKGLFEECRLTSSFKSSGCLDSAWLNDIFSIAATALSLPDFEYSDVYVSTCSVFSCASLRLPVSFCALCAPWTCSCPVLTFSTLSCADLVPEAFRSVAFVWADRKGEMWWWAVRGRQHRGSRAPNLSMILCWMRRRLSCSECLLVSE